MLAQKSLLLLGPLVFAATAFAQLDMTITIHDQGDAFSVKMGYPTTLVVTNPRAEGWLVVEGSDSHAIPSQVVPPGTYTRPFFTAVNLLGPRTGVQLSRIERLSPHLAVAGAEHRQQGVLSLLYNSFWGTPYPDILEMYWFVFDGDPCLTEVGCRVIQPNTLVTLAKVFWDDGTVDTFQYEYATTAAIPEPSGIVLLITGASIYLLFKRRQRGTKAVHQPSIRIT